MIARNLNFYPRMKFFNRVFYKALRMVGVNYLQAREELMLLTRHREHLRLTKRQTRGLYGLHHGVFDEHGRFKEGMDMAAVGPSIGIGDGDWPMIYEEALKFSNKLPDQVDVRDEFRWVNSRMFEWPDFATAPSKTAIKWWLGLNNPEGTPPAFREFMRVSMTKRLTPGDRNNTFEEDSAPAKREADRESEQRDQELMDRLFGGEGDGP